jgi:FMN-dependent oxidoreductase (nitrilotriacetate monooxygenase family)
MNSMLTLATTLSSIGNHLVSWRHPDAWERPAMNLRQSVELAQLAEQGLFDLLFVADGNGVRNMDKPILFEATGPADRPTSFEPFTYLSAISQHTSHIGLVGTACTTFEEPYLLARRVLSLDHLSGGRAAWNVVTGAYPNDALNFNRDEPIEKSVRYDRSREFVEVVQDLWDSWAEDAFVQDKGSGRFLDSSRVHTQNHKGRHFQVKGPLNAARSPQGRPVLFLAGQSEEGRELAAYAADCVFALTNTIDAALSFRNDLHKRLEKFGREPEELRVLPGCTVYIGATESEAEELFDELQSLITPALGTAYLSELMYTDLTKNSVDDKLPLDRPDVSGVASFRDTILDMAAAEELTIRQTYERVVPSVGHLIFKGNPTQIADQIEWWYNSGACDGFNVIPAVKPRCLVDFIRLVVPELQRRGIFRTHYEGTTLRENLGLRVPASRYFPSA